MSRNRLWETAHKFAKRLPPLMSINRNPGAPERPLANSYWVINGRLLGGEHPGGVEAADMPGRLRRLREAGIQCYVDLTEHGEHIEYRHLLSRNFDVYTRFAIPDTSVPARISQTREILSSIHGALAQGRGVYVHCLAGIGRTGLILGCFLADEARNGRSALSRLNQLWRQSARAATWPRIPQTAEQADYIRRWPALRSLDENRSA
jgi:hypothetical protein